VGIVPSKLDRALSLIRKGCDLKLITDNVAAAQAISAFGQEHGHDFNVWIEVDTDGHRSGVQPESDLLLEVASALSAPGAHVGGVMTHAGASYGFDTPQDLAKIAAQEAAGATKAAQRLREAGFPCPEVSIGSTPTALSYQQLQGVTEVRAGVYVFFDLVMHNIGVCTKEEIALSVLTTVIGHQPEKGWVIVDAGWMAMSRDRGTAQQKHDYGYGQVCDQDGNVLEGYIMVGANQEHGILANAGSPDQDIVSKFPIGTVLRILPNHACATAAQYPDYLALMPDGTTEKWQRFYGW